MVSFLWILESRSCPDVTNASDDRLLSLTRIQRKINIISFLVSIVTLHSRGDLPWESLPHSFPPTLLSSIDRCADGDFWLPLKLKSKNAALENRTELTRFTGNLASWVRCGLSIKGCLAVAYPELSGGEREREREREREKRIGVVMRLFLFHLHR